MLKRYFIFTFLFLMTLGSAYAQQASSFSLSGLSRFQGMNLSVYYVSGRPAGLGTQGQEIQVHKVLSGPHIYSIHSDSLKVNSVNVPRDGWTTYNYVVFVVHRQASHALTNIAWSQGQVVREPVVYLDNRFVDTNGPQQAYIFRGGATSSQIERQSDIRL